MNHRRKIVVSLLSLLAGVLVCPPGADARRVDPLPSSDQAEIKKMVHTLISSFATPANGLCLT
jgi:hypothetical protein